MRSGKRSKGRKNPSPNRMVRDWVEKSYQSSFGSEQLLFYSLTTTAHCPLLTANHFSYRNHIMIPQPVGHSLLQQFLRFLSNRHRDAGRLRLLQYQVGIF